MDYVARVPAPPLDRYIDDLYYLSGKPRHARINVPPMPSAHLFLNLGDPARLWNSDPAAAPAFVADGWFAGMWTRRFTVEYPASVRLLGVHFKPWGTSPFTGMPASELTNRWVPVDAVWQRSLDRIRNRLHESGATAEALHSLEAELLARLVDAPPHGLGLVRHTARRLERAHGAVAIAGLADTAGVSASHLNTQFRLHVGVSPKRVARIYRFARLILSVDVQGPVDWAETAHRGGYFDQAHFSREFKEFTGHTPSQYLALRRRMPAEPDFPPDAGPMPAELLCTRPAPRPRDNVAPHDDEREDRGRSDHAQRGVGGRIHR
ncbi:helix-turn-helix transcriptional regulator [Glycomyces terrestris]|uniref:AraC family transcriptional regulator n=1 Tax=Glycomyces terrestris TaxID=2493553 RepID=A0A426UVS9_9ACTN|nr:helix-turn-helix transcriptional regulator [Glycomyces terrestris]RRR98455.1 AraC family transcriptional regulator [Glycomyces terrestris]